MNKEIKSLINKAKAEQENLIRKIAKETDIIKTKVLVFSYQNIQNKREALCEKLNEMYNIIDRGKSNDIKRKNCKTSGRCYI